MGREKQKARLAKLEGVYHLHAKDIYRICFYYAGDKRKAKQMMLQVFKDLSGHIDDVTPENAIGYMAARVRSMAQRDMMNELTAKQKEVTA